MKKVLFLALSSLLFFSACGESQTKKAQVIEQKKEVVAEQKSITLTTLEDSSMELSFSNNILVSKELNGKITLINFFATWCPPCIEEIPTFNKLYEEHGDIFQIVGVLYEKDKSKEEILAFAKKHNIKFPITLGEENFVAAKMFNDVKKIPESFLFSKEGFLFEKYVGIVNEKILEEYLQANKK
ncbi:MAG: TlpA disulfide reductase family protein [Arcobacteraceae bacterium]